MLSAALPLILVVVAVGTVLASVGENAVLTIEPSIKKDFLLLPDQIAMIMVQTFQPMILVIMKSRFPT